MCAIGCIRATWGCLIRYDARLQACHGRRASNFREIDAPGDRKVKSMFETLNRFFPLWALVFAGIAVVAPTPFVALKGTIQPLLALIMFAMGLTLSRDDFIRVARRPGPIALGFDDLELEASTQLKVCQLMENLNADNFRHVGDYAGFKQEFLNLNGFGFENIDYSQAIDNDMFIK